MKKNNKVVTASAVLGTTIAILLSSAGTAQAAMFAAISGDNEPQVQDDMFLQLQQLLDPIENAARKLIDTIAGNQYSKMIVSLDTAALGGKLKASGSIVDMTAWKAAADLIANKGFIAFLENLRDMNTRLDRIIADAESKFATWSKLDSNMRMAALTDADDDSIAPAIAKIGNAVTQLHSYATSGMMLLHELAMTSQDQEGSDRPDQDVEEPALV